MRQLNRSEHRTEHEAPRRLTTRLMWFGVLWIASVATLVAVAYGIRLWLGLG